MASKENQELMHKLCNEILTTIQFNTNRDVITGLQNAIDNEELYKKVFELLSTDYFNSQGGYYFDNFETMKEKYLEQARKELENGK